MSRFTNALTSSVGKKQLMALSGLALVGFVIAHMLGNLQVFAGQDQLNTYAKKLQDLGPLLWLMRLGLLTIFVVHVWTGIVVATQNSAARGGSRYVKYEPQVTSLAARTMIWTGLVVLAFIVYHLLHFTFGAVQGENHGHLDAAGRHDVYRMVVQGFLSWPVTISYVVAQAILAMHLWHGTSSAFQTLGVTHPRLLWLKRCLGPWVAVIVFVGNTAIPVAILAGVVALPPGVR